MTDERRIILIAVVATTLLGLALMGLAFLFIPSRTWLMFRNFLPVLGIGLATAASTGFLLARYLIGATRKDADERERKLRMFLADTGHELRTPLAVMRGTVDTLGRSIAAADVTGQALLDGLKQEIARLSRLVQNVLLLARLDMSPMRRIDAINVAEMLEELAAEARLRSPMPEVRVVVKEALTIAGEPVALREAIRNLIDNAVNYGAPPITLFGETIPRGVRIAVADEGPGMDEEDRLLAFERHYRGLRAEGVVGSGLGLAVVKATVERLGGAAEIGSGPDGTRVSLTLPSTADQQA